MVPNLACVLHHVTTTWTMVCSANLISPAEQIERHPPPSRRNAITLAGVLDPPSQRIGGFIRFSTRRLSARVGIVRGSAVVDPNKTGAALTPQERRPQTLPGQVDRQGQVEAA
jgi:hypothetical protein